MPTFKLNDKNLVHFAVWKSHIGFYATPAGNEAFKKRIIFIQKGKGFSAIPSK